MLKLGVIDVLNVLPVYYQLLSTAKPKDFEPVYGIVTELNRKLNQGLIDLSVVSSFEYALHPELYQVIPDLCVGSKGAVGSIYLFSELPINALEGQTVLLTEHSLTSVHLIQSLLKDQKVRYTTDPNTPHQASLLIADQAIRRFYQKRDAYVADLGQWWYQVTGLPFVFALWVVRTEIYQSQPLEVNRLVKQLWDSRDQATHLLDQMVAHKYQAAFPDPKACRDYLANLHYQLTAEFLQGFERFQSEMVKIKKLPQVVTPRFLPGF